MRKVCAEFSSRFALFNIKNTHTPIPSWKQSNTRLKPLVFLDNERQHFRQVFSDRETKQKRPTNWVNGRRHCVQFSAISLPLSPENNTKTEKRLVLVSTKAYKRIKSPKGKEGRAPEFSSRPSLLALLKIDPRTLWEWFSVCFYFLFGLALKKLGIV